MAIINMNNNNIFQFAIFYVPNCHCFSLKLKFEFWSNVLQQKSPPTSRLLKFQHAINAIIHIQNNAHQMLWFDSIYHRPLIGYGRKTLKPIPESIHSSTFFHLFSKNNIQANVNIRCYSIYDGLRNWNKREKKFSLSLKEFIFQICTLQISTARE